MATTVWLVAGVIWARSRNPPFRVRAGDIDFC